MARFCLSSLSRPCRGLSRASLRDPGGIVEAVAETRGRGRWPLSLPCSCRPAMSVTARVGRVSNMRGVMRCVGSSGSRPEATSRAHGAYSSIGIAFDLNILQCRCKSTLAVMLTRASRFAGLTETQQASQPGRKERGRGWRLDTARDPRVRRWMQS